MRPTDASTFVCAILGAAGMACNAATALPASPPSEVYEAMSAEAAVRLLDPWLADAELPDDEREALLDLLEPMALMADGQTAVGSFERVVARVLTRDALLGENVAVFKLLDESGIGRQVVLTADGRLLSPDHLERQEEAARSVRGKLHPALAERLIGRPVDEVVPVLFWCTVAADVPPIARPDPSKKLSEADQALLDKRLDEAARLRNERFAVPLVDALRAQGFKAAIVPGAPMVSAHLPVGEVEKVAARPEVMDVYLDGDNVPQLATARVTVGASVVNSRGMNGSGVRVAVVEVGGRMNTANPLRPGFTQSLTDSCLDDHAAGVSGVVASLHGTDRGLATGVNLWLGGSCGGSDSQLQCRMTDARSWGARVINNSWGWDDSTRVPNATSRFIDRLVLDHWRLVVGSAGNRGLELTPNVTNPNINYNGLSVGNVDDRGTNVPGDDVMNADSSFRNPTSTHGDREKPDVAAPGTRIRTLTNSSPWLREMSGTSFAAPAVAATAALLMQRAPGLANWPEALRAIIMATAVNNVEGVSRLSDRDGAGAIRADVADDVARGVNGSWAGINYTCSSASPLNATTMSLRAGKRVRVAIAWSSDPGFSSYASRPSADLDLSVVGPVGTTVVYSSSFDNTSEVIDFTPSVSGTYTLRVVRFRCDLSPRYLGYAWYQTP